MTNENSKTDISTVKRRNTIQKKLIVDTLRSLGSHVSASAVYHELQRTHPEIGRATVFRVLSQLSEDGDLLRLSFSESDDRFDVTVYPHYHCICRKCGLVLDVDFDGDEIIENAHVDGFEIEEAHIEFIGLCDKCKSELQLKITDNDNSK